MNHLTSVFGNKVTLLLFIFAIFIGGVAAQASGILNTPEGGYLVCVDSKTKVVTHPGTSNCAKGTKKLVLGAQGATGLMGAAGLPGRDGMDGKDGKTLWSGVKDPEGTWGSAGDMFINSVTKTLFGPKNLDGTWPAGVSLVGPKGDQGPIGLTGATGASGASGASGATGASGVKITELSICGIGGTSLCKNGAIGPGGGLIFFVDYNDQYAGFNYLEAAPKSCESNSIGWSSANTSVPDPSGWVGRAVGAGASNTAAIKAIFTSDTVSNNAAYFASSCSAGSKSDWFLGSYGEMKLMYDNLQGLGEFFETYYLSSSEANSAQAWGLHFYLGGMRLRNKTAAVNIVRPVRAF